VTPRQLGSGVPAPALSPEAFGVTGTRRSLGAKDGDELIEFDVHRTG
jgi:hypothetical protein